MDERLRPVGPRRRRPLQQVQLPGPWFARRRARRSYILLEKGSEGYKTDLNNFAPSAEHRLAAERAVRLPAQDPRRPAQATFRAGYADGVRPPGAHTLHGPLWRQPRRVDLAEPRTPTRDWCRRASRGRSSSRRPTACIPRRSTPIRPTRSPSARTGPTASTRSRRTSRSRGADLDGRLRAVDLRRTWRSRSATSATAATTSGRRSTTTAAPPTRQLHRIRGENLVANGFMNEFKLAMGNLAGQQRLGRREPRRLVCVLRRAAPAPARCRSISRTSMAARGRRQPCRLRGKRRQPTTWANSTIAGRLAGPNPNPNGAAATSTAT